MEPEYDIRQLKVSTCNHLNYVLHAQDFVEGIVINMYLFSDHSIYLYDLRNPQKELKMVKGHSKTVSYVKYLSEKELLSA